MTVLIVLAGMLISHLLMAVGRWRHFDWWLWPVRRLREQFADADWIALAAVIVFSVVASWLAVWLVTTLFGVVGWAVLALVVFISTLGPRDLDQDVRVVLERAEQQDPAVVEEAADSMQLDLEADAPAGVAAVFHAALSRWFGILFWFVVLGIAGAVLYRLNRMALQMESLRPAEVEWLARLRIVLDWPLMFLVIISAGLCGDLDRVYRAWKKRDEPWWLATPATLDRVAAAHVSPDDGIDEGLKAGHRMVWRMLVLWLVVMSLLLLAGWLA